MAGILVWGPQSDSISKRQAASSAEVSKKKAPTNRQGATTSWLDQRQVRKGVGALLGGEIRSSAHLPIVTSCPESRYQHCLLSKGVEARKLPTLVERVVPRFHRSTIMTTLYIPCPMYGVPCTMYRGSSAVAEPRQALDSPWCWSSEQQWCTRGRWQDSCAQVLLVNLLARRIVAQQLRDLVRRII